MTNAMVTPAQNTSQTICSEEIDVPAIEPGFRRAVDFILLGRTGTDTALSQPMTFYQRISQVALISEEVYKDLSATGRYINYEMIQRGRECLGTIGADVPNIHSWGLSPGEKEMMTEMFAWRKQLEDLFIEAQVGQVCTCSPDEMSRTPTAGSFAEAGVPRLRTDQHERLVDKLKQWRVEGEAIGALERTEERNGVIKSS